VVFGSAAMVWRPLRLLIRYRELALAVAFVGMGAWELLEMGVLEPARGSPLSVVVHSLQVGLILAATWAVLRAWREKTRQEEALGRMVEKVVFAQEEERRRIAYDLHDGIAQLIVSTKQHLDTCHDLLRRDPAVAEQELTKSVDRLQRAIVETRRVLMALRPLAVDSQGLGSAARRSLEELAQEAGWAVRFENNLGEDRLPPAIETAAFRILQEALANAHRHGRASRVEVGLWREGDWLRLEVRDFGIGFAPTDAPPTRGLGLLSMRERARLLGGACTIERVPSGGTRVSAELPVRTPLSNGHTG
jgi:signal transduction histidine kinase